jgi:maleamate amidohydrolase
LNSCGEDAWIGIAEIRRLVEATRAKGVPVIYTTGAFRRDQWDMGGWSWKNSRSNEWSASTASKRQAR